MRGVMVIGGGGGVMRGVIGIGVRVGVVRGITGGGARSEKGKRGPDPANLLMHVLTEHLTRLAVLLL